VAEQACFLSTVEQFAFATAIAALWGAVNVVVRTTEQNASHVVSRLGLLLLLNRRLL